MESERTLNLKPSTLIPFTLSPRLYKDDASAEIGSTQKFTTGAKGWHTIGASIITYTILGGSLL